MSKLEVDLCASLRQAWDEKQQQQKDRNKQGQKQQSCVKAWYLQQFFGRLRYWEKDQILLETEVKEGGSLFSFLLVPKYIYVGGDFSNAWETLGHLSPT